MADLEDDLFLIDPDFDFDLDLDGLYEGELGCVPILAQEDTWLWV